MLSTVKPCALGAFTFKRIPSNLQMLRIALRSLTPKKNVLIVPPQQRGNVLNLAYRPIPAKSQGRNGIVTNSIYLIKHLAEETLYLIVGDSASIEIGQGAFPMNTDTFFYVRYQFKGEAINKKLPFEGKLVKLSTGELSSARFLKSEITGDSSMQGDTLLQIDPTMADSFEFRYYDIRNSRHIPFFDPRQPDSLQQREFIPFRPVFISSSEAKEQIEFIAELLLANDSSISKDQLINRTQGYLKETYGGKIDRLNFIDWLEQQGLGWNE